MCRCRHSGPFFWRNSMRNRMLRSTKCALMDCRFEKDQKWNCRLKIHTPKAFMRKIPYPMYVYILFLLFGSFSMPASCLWLLVWLTLRASMQTKNCTNNLTNRKKRTLSMLEKKQTECVCVCAYRMSVPLLVGAEPYIIYVYLS